MPATSTPVSSSSLRKTTVPLQPNLLPTMSTTTDEFDEVLVGHAALLSANGVPDAMATGITAGSSSSAAATMHDMSLSAADHHDEAMPDHCPSPPLIRLHVFCSVCRTEANWSGTAQADPARRVWCRMCRRSILSRRYLCSCGLPWVACEQHRHFSARQDATRRIHTADLSSRAPLLPVALFEAAAASEQPAAKRARRAPRVCLSDRPQQAAVRPNLLGPKLRERFQHLL